MKVERFRIVREEIVGDAMMRACLGELRGDAWDRENVHPAHRFVAGWRAPFGGPLRSWSPFVRLAEAEAHIDGLRAQGKPFGLDVPDWQRARVYRWDRRVARLAAPALHDLDSARDRVAEACGFLGVDPPSVRAARPDARKSSYDPLAHEIRFRVGRFVALDEQSVLHESGHAGDRWGLPAHGPTFVRTAIRLYERFLGIDGDVLERLADGEGILRARPIAAEPSDEAGSGVRLG